MSADLIFPLAVLGGLGFFAWRYFKHGSLSGVLLNGRIREELGEVDVSESSFASQVVKVLRMEDSKGEPFVGVSIVSKAPLAASAQAFKLSHEQALELSALLKAAAK